MADKNEAPSTSEVVENGGYSNGEVAPRKRGVMNTLYPPGKTPGAGPRIKNHCRKFWWCDLLVVAIIALVIVLPIIFVAIPNKAQHDINASTLEVTEQDITSPQPEGLHLKLVSLAKSGSSFHPTLDAFRASLSLKNKDPFLFIDIPEAKANAETTIVVEQDVKFASADQFTEYNKMVMGSEQFEIYLSGKTKVHQSGLKGISVDYNKVITMKGLNKLKGLNITDLTLLNKTLDDGSNMKGNVFIPNPSVMTLSLGNVTMNLVLDGTPIGISLLPDLVIKPGDNNVPMQSTVNQSAVLNYIMAKKTAVIPLDILGNSSMVGDQHLKYFEAAIQSNTVRVDLNVGPALAGIGLNVQTLIGGGS
ncbi:uncharacterized protein BDR25DRAFT_265942 [Lindgomyces ingoldianus]|uniref:Uncharacterized protein n=1 Tax=Lindgomyces ingoldianus TaxID=673940 RepID=A0ACB6QQ51_9PLEO|nr:uncharacterized protein BDR25DRAFT_265942 [Lindgomyces ingoldianus]KAF2468217.1 hypothetical protein BDR25DRAFT_265942 [Lindgomyces ingoldianus]